MDQCKIGKFIASCRKEKNLTQAQLAEKLNITDRAVSKWENGKCLPDSSIMIELCEILDITVNELLTGEKLEPEHAQQTAEENLLALKKKDEKGRAKSRSFIAALLFLFITFSTVFATFTVKTIEKSRELKHNQRALSGMYSTVGDEDVLTDEAQKIVHLITGTSWGNFVFSYQADETAERIKLLCDTYVLGEKTETSILLDHKFVKSHENSYTRETDVTAYPAFKEEILTNYPRHGYLFVDVNNRVTACTDEYMVESKLIDEDGTTVEDFGRYETLVRLPGKFPSANYIWSYRFHLSETIQSSGGKITPEDAASGNPVLLFLYGDDHGGENSTEKFGKTADEILSTPELLNSFEVCNVFYCVFEYSIS